MSNQALRSYRLWLHNKFLLPLSAHSVHISGLSFTRLPAQNVEHSVQSFVTGSTTIVHDGHERTMSWPKLPVRTSRKTS